MIAKSERLAVLSDAEQEALYGLPDFDDAQRLVYLALAESELALASSRYSTDEISDELIHDHRFSFWSKVLCGVIRSEVFERAEAGEEGTRLYRSFSYRPEDKDVENFYKYTGDVFLKIRESQRTDRDNVYYLYFDSIHRICPPEHEAMSTLVLRSPRLRSHSTVFNSTYPTTDVQIQNTFWGCPR